MKQKPIPEHIAQKVDVGDIVAISTAHTFQYGYWKNYSTFDYKIEKVTPYEIVGRDVLHPHTMICVTERQLSNGFMKVNI